MLALVQIDILTGNLGHSIGSLGGFSCGNKTVVNHQVSSSFFVFFSPRIARWC
jgi:7-keto-8-aminopelargonate synthetase-like enzyme